MVEYSPVKINVNVEVGIVGEGDDFGGNACLADGCIIFLFSFKGMIEYLHEKIAHRIQINKLFQVVTGDDVGTMQASACANSDLSRGGATVYTFESLYRAFKISPAA